MTDLGIWENEKKKDWRRLKNKNMFIWYLPEVFSILSQHQDWHTFQDPEKWLEGTLSNMQQLRDHNNRARIDFFFFLFKKVHLSHESVSATDVQVKVFSNLDVQVFLSLKNQ